MLKIVSATPSPCLKTGESANQGAVPDQEKRKTGERKHGETIFNTIAKEVISMVLVKNKIRKIVSDNGKRASKEYLEVLSMMVAKMVELHCNSTKMKTLKAEDSMGG